MTDSQQTLTDHPDWSDQTSLEDYERSAYVCHECDAGFETAKGRLKHMDLFHAPPAAEADRDD